MNQTHPDYFIEFSDDFYDLDRDVDHRITTHEIGYYREMLGREEDVSDNTFREQNIHLIEEIEDIDGAVHDHEATEEEFLAYLATKSDRWGDSFTRNE